MSQKTTIKSMGILRQLHLISAGKTGGMPITGAANKVDQLCSTYVNDVPIKYYDGDKPKYNMGDNIKVITRNGVANQAEILAVGGVGNTIDVSAEVKHSIPITRSVQAAATSAQVTLGFPEGLDFNGGPGVISLIIWTKLSTLSEWYRAKDVTYYDYSNTAFEESWRVDRPAGIGSWQIKVERVSEDSTDLTYRNKTTFSSYVEWVPDNTTYDNYAIAAFVADAKNLNSTSAPTVSFLWDGIYCKVPNNYTAMQYDGYGGQQNPSYNGSWDGITFVEQVTNNPVWILYYLLTNDVNGLGQRIKAENIDVWNFYNSAKYCDELLPVIIDGVSTTRPRYTFDWQFLERVDAWTLLSEVAGTINAKLIYMGDRISINMDRPATADMVITRDSVIDGNIIWSGASRKDLTTSVCVKWYNPTNNYRAEEVTVTADDYFGFGAGYITRYGYNVQNVTAVGCTTEAQAIRYARWMLEQSLTSTAACRFKMGFNGFSLQPGQLIIVSDPTYSGTQVQGRLTAATANSITSLDPIGVQGGQVLYLNKKGGGVMTCTVSSTNISTYTILHGGYVGGTLADVMSGSEYSTSTQAPIMRVIDIASEDDDDGITIDCRQYNNASYSRIDTGVVVSGDTAPRSAVEAIGRPVGLIAADTTTNVDGSVRRAINVSWAPAGDTIPVKYLVSWACDDGVKGNQETVTPNIEISGINPVKITVSVRAVGASGLISDPGILVYTPKIGEANSSPLLPVTDLGIRGTGGTTFVSADLEISWIANSGNNTYLTAEYKIAVYDIAGSNPIRVDYVPHVPGQSAYYWTYSFAQNVSDGGPRRALKVVVWPKDCNGALGIGSS